MKPYLVDVPVRVMIWTRPDCLRQQFEVLKKARPSILLLISDGGRNEEEQKLILESRSIFDNIDWDCQVHKLYFDQNQGMYGMQKHVRSFIWDKVDRCIFLEDDYIPSVSYFQFCAELLEKYKDDERIEMICGNNPFGEYKDAEPYDYFFSENGWSIWGTAFWKRTVINREFPLDYENNEYIKRCIKDNVNVFWNRKVESYCKRELCDNHVPGAEYFHAVNSVLYHRLFITPTKNMIRNIGFDGAHFNSKSISQYRFLNVPEYEIEFPIKHPKYVIDDKHYGKLYDELLEHDIGSKKWKKRRIKGIIKLLYTGKIFRWIMIKLKIIKVSQETEK